MEKCELCIYGGREMETDFLFEAKCLRVECFFPHTLQQSLKKKVHSKRGNWNPPDFSCKSFKVKFDAEKKRKDQEEFNDSMDFQLGRGKYRILKKKPLKKGTKTLKVVDFIERINDKLEKSKTSSKDRLALCKLLEEILHDTNNYNGFTYLESAGTVVDANGKVTYKDESRRLYVNSLEIKS